MCCASWSWNSSQGGPIVKDKQRPGCLFNKVFEILWLADDAVERRTDCDVLRHVSVVVAAGERWMSGEFGCPYVAGLVFLSGVRGGSEFRGGGGGVLAVAVEEVSSDLVSPLEAEEVWAVVVSSSREENESLTIRPLKHPQRSVIPYVRWDFSHDDCAQSYFWRHLGLSKKYLSFFEENRGLAVDLHRNQVDRILVWRENEAEEHPEVVVIEPLPPHDHSFRVVKSWGNVMPVSSEECLARAPRSVSPREQVCRDDCVFVKANMALNPIWPSLDHLG